MQITVDYRLPGITRPSRYFFYDLSPSATYFTGNSADNLRRTRLEKQPSQTLCKSGNIKGIETFCLSFLVFVVLSSQILGERSTQRSQRWLMPVTNTIQGSHLRDIRNPIRGFDLHKPTLDRVTRGHLSCDQRTWPCFSLRYSPLCERRRPTALEQRRCPFLTSAFRLIILFVVPAFVSRLRDPWKRSARTRNSVESLVIGKRTRTRMCRNSFRRCFGFLIKTSNADIKDSL